MFALARSQIIYLAAAGLEGSDVLAAYTEKNHLGDVTKIESDTPTVGAAVLSDLVPDDIGFV